MEGPNDYRNSIPLRTSIIEADDYLGLITKAVESAYKHNVGPIDDTYFLDPNVMKWMNRAEASVLRDRKLIKKIRDYYVTKWNTRPMMEDQYDRTEKKKKQWARLPNFTFDLDLKETIEHASALFQEDIGNYQEQADAQEHDGTPYFVYASSLRYLREAQDALQLWNSESNLTAVLKMLNEEMKLFAESAESYFYTEDPILGGEMINHAIKALAWKVRARQLQTQTDTFSAENANAGASSAFQRPRQRRGNEMI